MREEDEEKIKINDESEMKENERKVRDEKKN